MNRYEMFAAMLQRLVVVVYGVPVTPRDAVIMDDLSDIQYRAKCVRVVGRIDSICVHDMGCLTSAPVHQFVITMWCGDRQRTLLVRSEVEGVA